MSAVQILPSSTVNRRADVAHFARYASRLNIILQQADWGGVALLAADLHRCWREGRSVFICGNGGSAGNAIHLANDYLYGIAKDTGLGMRVQALSANASVPLPNRTRAPAAKPMAAMTRGTRPFFMVTSRISGRSLARPLRCARLRLGARQSSATEVCPVRV